MNFNQQSKSTSGITMLQSCEPARRSELEIAQDNLDTEIGILNEKLTMLEKRLYPVLNPVPTGDGEDCCETGLVAPVVSFIGRNTRVAQGFNNRIDDLLRNLAI